MSRSQRSEDTIPPSQRSSSDRPRQERHSHNGPNGGYQSKRERRERRSHDRLSTQGRGQYARPPTTASSNHSRHNKSSLPPQNPVTYQHLLEMQTFSEKCSNLCSIRGILQFVEITAGILVLICVVASYAVISGYTSAAGFGSFSINSAYSPFEGAELQQVRDVDLQYSQMRAPGVYGGVAITLVLSALTIVFMILGAKPINTVSIRVLYAELVFDVVACLGYIVAVGLYLHFIKQVNASDTCKKREQLYAGRGYTWMNCSVQGGDAAVALFGLIAGCVYLPSTVLCGLYIRTVRDFRKVLIARENPSSSYSNKPKKLDESRKLVGKDTVQQPSTLV